VMCQIEPNENRDKPHLQDGMLWYYRVDD